VQTLSDEDLIAQLQLGQTDALDELYRRHARQLYVFCYHTMRQNPQQAEDLVHDVFERIIKSAHTFNPRKAAFRTWMFRIARNHCIDVMRRNTKLSFVPIEQAPEAPGDAPALADTLPAPDDGVEATVEHTTMIQAVRECIRALENDDEKQAILLYYLGDKVYREIATILGKSLSMARNYIKAAQDKVKGCLEGKGITSVIY